MSSSTRRAAAVVVLVLAVVGLACWPRGQGGGAFAREGSGFGPRATWWVR